MPPDPDSFASAPLFPAARSPRPHSAEDRAAEAAVASAGRIVGQILGDAPLLALLSSRGLGSAAVQRGAALHILAQQACEECQNVFSALDAAHAARASALAAARDDYRDFRRAVSAACANDLIRDPLESSANRRQTLRAFVVQATASYLAALKTIPPELIARHGFAVSRTNAALTRVQRLVVLDTLFHTRARHATRSTRDRDRSIARLTAWTCDLLDGVQRALGQPGTFPIAAKFTSTPGRRNVHGQPLTISALSNRFNLRFLGSPGD